MHKQLQRWILALSLMMLSSLNTAYALTSTGADGAFTLNNALTLNASNNQTFNFTTFNLGTGGTLDFSGLTSQDSIFILATGDIHLDGVLNLSSNLTFETTGNIFVGGTINIGSNAFSLTSGSNITFSSGWIINGISGYSGNNNQNPPNNAGACVVIGGFTCYEKPVVDIVSGKSGPTATNPGGSISHAGQVPEPSTYALLLAGISLLMLRRNKFSN